MRGVGEMMEVYTSTVERTWQELDEAALLLSALSERCSDVATGAEYWKDDIEALAPETHKRVRDVIRFLFEVSHTLNFVSRDLESKSFEFRGVRDKKLKSRPLEKSAA